MVAGWEHRKGAGDFGAMDAPAPDRRGGRRRIPVPELEQVHTLSVCGRRVSRTGEP